jgi:imidazolonepropionase
MSSLLLKNARQVVTAIDRGKPLSGKQQSELSVMNDVSILVRDGMIREISGESLSADRVIDCRDYVILPGLVDAHTHIVYAGSRYEEFYQRIAGSTYLEILEAGNGIKRTIRETEAATPEQIYSESSRRVENAISRGTTTMEIKTGYSSSVDGESKMIDVMDMIATSYRINIIKTLLPLHAISMGRNEREHLSYVIRDVLPRTLERVDFVDSFCDSGAFSPESTESFFAAAGNRDKRLHSDEIENIGCLSLASKFKLKSADHLLKTDDSGVDKLLASGTIANFLPITAFSLGERYPDVRRYINKGVPVAISSDSSPLTRNQDLIFALYLSLRFYHLSAEEAFNAVTINASHSLGVADKTGTLERGKRADIVIADVSDFREIPYEYSSQPIQTVISGGNIVFNRR